MEKIKDIYMMTLDALDFNSLPISQGYSGRGAVPLWSMSHLDSRKNDYYEFVIKTDETEEGLNEPVIKHVPCHICNINVPEGYFKKHKNSSRHKFNRKVADTALKRLQLYADMEYNNENNEELPSKHFCVECSIVINSEDETSHKQTIAHRSTVFLERFLKDFLIFYTRDDNEAVDNKSKDRETELVKESKNCEQEYTSDELNTEETLTIHSLTNSDGQKSITETVTNVKKEEEESMKEEIREMKEEIKEMKEEIKKIKRDERTNAKHSITNSTCDLLGGDIVFNIKDGYRFQVPQPCYWSLVQINASSEYCMMCNCMYQIENRTIHTESQLHGDNSYAKPLDGNCVRKISESHYHCVLCNDYFTEYDLHLDSEEHAVSFDLCLKLDDSDKTGLDNDNCNNDETCHDSEDSDALRIDDTESLTDVNKNTDQLDTTSDSLKPCTSTSVPVHPTVLCDTCNAWISKKQFKKHKKTERHMFNTISNYHYLFKPIDDENVNCLVCKGPIPNDMETIKEHFHCKYHVRKYNELLKAHNIIRICQNKYYCKECEVKILYKNEYMHIKTKKHSDKVGFYELDEIDEQSDVSADAADADDTEAALVHRNTVDDNTGAATDNVTVEPANSIALEAINQFDDNSRSIHHNSNMKTSFEDFHKSMMNWLVDINKQWENLTHPVVSEVIEPNEENVVRVNRYNCDVCNVKVVNSDKNILEHNRGRVHNMKLSQYVPQC